MRYNLEIHNDGALPIPYVDKCGDQILVGALFKDKPLFRDAICIQGTSGKQILVHCVTIDTIFESHPNLSIVFKSDAGEVA